MRRVLSNCRDVNASWRMSHALTQRVMRSAGPLSTFQINVISSRAINRKIINTPLVAGGSRVGSGETREARILRASRGETRFCPRSGRFPRRLCDRRDTRRVFLRGQEHLPRRFSPDDDGRGGQVKAAALGGLSVRDLFRESCCANVIIAIVPSPPSLPPVLP